MYFKGPVVVVAVAVVGTATSTGSGSISACIDPKILFPNRRNALATCGGRSAKGRVAACARVVPVDSATSGTAGAEGDFGRSVRTMVRVGAGICREGLIFVCAPAFEQAQALDERAKKFLRLRPQVGLKRPPIARSCQAPTSCGMCALRQHHISAL